METFPFLKHTIAIRYPESSATVKYSRGYEFASKPKGLDQLTLTLNYAGMFWFLNPNGTLDKVSNPTINMALLVDFYESKRLYEKFLYDCPGRGLLTVRFSKPLEWKLKENGR